MDLLVVECDPLVRETIVETLQEAGFDVSGAACAETALEIVAAEGPPAVLMADLSVRRGSGFDGADLATAIRRWQPRVGIVYTMGDPDCVPERHLEANERCLAKPFSSTKLMHAVCGLMPNHEFAARPALGGTACRSHASLPTTPARVMGHKLAVAEAQLEPK